MKRDIVISVIIGALLTYLPFWRWDSIPEQIVGTITFGAVAFVSLLVTEKREEDSR